MKSALETRAAFLCAQCRGRRCCRFGRVGLRVGSTAERGRKTLERSPGPPRRTALSTCEGNERMETRPPCPPKWTLFAIAAKPYTRAVDRGHQKIYRGKWAGGGGGRGRRLYMARLSDLIVKNVFRNTRFSLLPLRPRSRSLISSRRFTTIITPTAPSGPGRGHFRGGETGKHGAEGVPSNCNRQKSEGVQDFLVSCLWHQGVRGTKFAHGVWVDGRGFIGVAFFEGDEVVNQVDRLVRYFPRPFFHVTWQRAIVLSLHIRFLHHTVDGPHAYVVCPWYASHDRHGPLVPLFFSLRRRRHFRPSARPG